MKRRFLSVLLSLCLVLGLLPTAAFAQDTSNYVTQEDSITGLADGEQAFPEMVAESGEPGGEEQPELEDPVSDPQVESLWVNGKDILQAENRTVACGGGMAVYNPADNTLTLDNAEITEAYTYIPEDSDFDPVTSGIYIDGALTIVLNGENTISGENIAGIDNAIYSNDPITIRNGSIDGSLTVNDIDFGISCGGAATIYGVSISVDALCGFSVNELTIEDSNVTVNSFGDSYYAIQSATVIAINDSDVNFTAENIILNSGFSESSLTIEGDSHVTMHSTGDSAVYIGTVTITDGEVKIVSDTSYAVFAMEAFIVTGTPTVTVTGSPSAFWQGFSGPVIVGGVEYICDQDTVKIENGQVISGLRGPGVIVNGMPLAGSGSVPCGSGEAFYDSSSNTLTLRDAVINNGYSVSSYTYGIYADNDTDLTIILEGENAINGVDTGIESAAGITIQGDGSLTINSICFGISAMKVDITQNGTLDITVTGEKDIRPAWISGISAGTSGLTINGGTVIVKNLNPEGSCGIHSNAGVTINDSVVKTDGEVGILAEESVIISGNPTIQATGTGKIGAIYAGSGQIKKNGQEYIYAGGEVLIQEGQIISGLSPYVPEEPEPEPERPSDDDDHHDTGSTTESERNPDGSITTTVTKPDGTTTATTRNPDGSKEVVETKKDGTVVTTATDKSGNETKTTENPDGTSVVSVTRTDGSTSATTVDEDGLSVTVAALSESAVTQGQTGTVSLPMPSVSAAADLDSAPAVTLDLPADTAVKVEIPVENVAAGTVAVLVKADGTSEIVKTSVTTEDGVVLTLSAGETVKIVDNTKTFADVADTFWGADAVAFVSSRELFNGTSASDFSPNIAMDRAMIVTVLARLDGVDTTAGSAWYEAGVQWAVSSGISDGSGLDQNLTREQLATMLYRYAQYKGCDVSVGENTNILSYSDVSSVSEYAMEAMQWACGAGIIGGKDGLLDPAGNATRAEVAMMLMRFVALL